MKHEHSADLGEEPGWPAASAATARHNTRAMGKNAHPGKAQTPVESSLQHAPAELALPSGGIPRPSKKSRSKKLSIWLCILLFASLLTGFFSWGGYQTYNAQYYQYLSLVQSGIGHLQTAEKLLAALPSHPLNGQNIEQARREFTAAQADFVQVDQGLRALPGIIQHISNYGTKLRAALEMLPLAIEISQAGNTGCDLLHLVFVRLHDPFGASTQGLSAANVTTISLEIQQIKSIFYRAVDQIGHLSPDATQLDPRVSKLLSAFHTYQPLLLSAFDDADKLLVVLPTLLGLGKPAHYLIEILDSTELRPGGGFIGNYGILTLVNARVGNAYITDVDLLDRPFEASGGVIPYPATYSWFDIAPDSWSLRDANLDADFPTVARYSEQNYRLEGGRDTLQGVIAITPALIQHILEITGPIAVPEYHETITADNLISRIHYHQLAASEGLDTIPAPDGHSSQRKRFTELLSEHLLARIHQAIGSDVTKLASLAFTSLHTKDLQIYLNTSVAESFLQRFHLDASLQAPSRGDSLFVVDANIGGSKANSFIINTLEDRVTIDAQGNAIHHTTINYAWTIPGPVYGSSLYHDYVRVYVPPGSILYRQEGWDARGTSKAFGRAVWAGFFMLGFGQTRSITLLWMTPKVALHDAHGWHYQYLLQRQAGTQWTIHLQVTPSVCKHLTQISGGSVTDHSSITVPIQTVSGDINTTLDYTC